MDEDFPTRGYSLVIPTIAETQLTGWLATVQFQRLGHRYAVKFVHCREPRCERDGKPVAWHKLNGKAQAVAHKAADSLNAAAKMRAAS